MVGEMLHLGAICVLGVGTTGQAVIDYCLKLLQGGEVRIDSLDIYPGDAEAPFVPADSRVRIHPDTHQVSGEYDLTVVSPGIPPHSELYSSAQRCSSEVISEPEFAFSISPDRWLAITGTNGKTTTTALCTHLLNTGGFKARAAGNIGLPCISAIDQRQSGEWLVAELSSYQLASSRLLAPVVAILLNITPDHLHWHGSFAEYARVKESIFANMVPGDPRIIDATSTETRTIFKAFVAAGLRAIPLGTSEGLCSDMTVRCGAAEAAFVDSTTAMLTVVCAGIRHSLIPMDQLLIKGEHNLQNALAAAAAALAIGVDVEAVREGLATFSPLEHRIEPCGTVRGLHFFNDSKATNPEATIKALSAFEQMPLVVMMGGRDKGTELKELVAACVDSCRAVVCYGEAGERFHAEFEKLRGLELSLVGTFREAFYEAVNLAQPGDALLLSPACASFDEFSSYEHRGVVFKSLIQELGSADGQGQ